MFTTRSSRLVALLITLCVMAFVRPAAAEKKEKLNQKADGTLPGVFGWADFVPSDPTASKETVSEYVQPNGAADGKVIKYTTDVFDPKVGKVGNLEFEYVLWKGTRAEPTLSRLVVGSALLGGFHLTDADYGKKVGQKFAFLQIFTETNEAPKLDTPGSYRGLVNGNYPDWDKDPGFNYKGTEFDFIDIPAVPKVDDVETSFETALVCYTDKEVHLLSVFTWSYKSDGKGGLTGKSPVKQAKASDDLLDVYRTTFRDKTYFDVGTSCCVPEPAFYQLGTLLALGGWMLWRTAPARRRRKAAHRREIGSALPKVAVVLASLVFVGSSSAAQAQGKRRYLPEEPFPGGNYSGIFTNFDRDVVCGKAKIGRIEFDYDTYTKINIFDDKLNGGGGALAGVFKFDTKSGVRLKKGHRLAWAQIVKATFPGINEWNLKPNGKDDKTWFPDTSNGRKSPDYSINRQGSGPIDPFPNIKFSDSPFRFFNMGAQNWMAELGLLCLDETNNKGYVLGSFTWGFHVVPPKDGNPGSITREEPKTQGDDKTTLRAATDIFLNTLSNSFTGDPVPRTELGTTKWTFSKEPSPCWESVPELSTFAHCCLLSLLCAVGYGCSRRKRADARFVRR